MVSGPLCESFPIIAVMLSMLRLGNLPSWTMGNLGRAGYGASLEGMWPYTYDSCDIGTVQNQTINGLPLAFVQTPHAASRSYPDFTLQCDGER